MDIYSVGEMVIDFLPGENEGVYLRNAGGAPANVAIAAARLGLDTGFCGMLGNDDFGRFLSSVLEENKVKSLCGRKTDAAITTMAFVTLDKHGERSFTFARKPGADMLLEPEDICEAHIAASKIINAGSCSLSQPPQSLAVYRALDLAKTHGRLVAFDVNYRALMWRGDERAAADAIMDILPFVDLLKISDEEVCLLGGEKVIPALMEKHGIELTALTLGAKGARCYWKGSVFNMPCPVVERVDTTGAGDAFWGGFLSALIRGGVEKAEDLNPELLKKALREANAAGTISVQRKGAIDSLPSYQEILECLKGGGFD